MMETYESAEVTKIPCAERIEKSVISVMMTHEYVEGEETLTEDHFHLSNVKKVFRLLVQNRDFNISSVTQILIERGELDSFGGPSALSELYMFQPSDGYFKGHLEILHEYHARRLGLKASEMAKRASLNLEDKDGFLAAFANPVTEVFDAAAAVTPTEEKSSVVDRVMDGVKDLILGKKKPIGISTGFPEIDNTLMGLKPKRLWYVQAPPEGGKSMLAIQIAYHVARQGIGSLFLSAEMTRDDCVSRLLPQASGLPALVYSDPATYLMRSGHKSFTKDQLTSMKEGAENIKDSPIFFEDPTAPTIDQVRALIRKHVRKNKVFLVVVDYIGLIRCPGQKDERMELQEISRQLQGIAKELSLHIIVLTQQNEKGQTKGARAAEEDADALLAIAQDRVETINGQKNPDFGKKLGIDIRKDRHHGASGTRLPIFLNKENLIFETRIDQDHERP